jgi:hypothetical protein
VGVKPAPPATLLAQAAGWEGLTRWERAELSRALRRLGWSYGEIRELIPVPKGTLSNWCRDIRLSDEQVQAIKTRTGSQVGVPRDTQRKRRAEIDRIRSDARAEVPTLVADPFWVAGTMLYWGEGSKTSNGLALANADPRGCRLFIRWTRQYHDPAARFVLKLNLHADNDEPAARRFWAAETGLGANAEFYKTFIKPDGTGHRKNHLAYGVCQVRLRRGTDAFHRTMAWIDAVAAHLSLD